MTSIASSENTLLSSHHLLLHYASPDLISLFVAVETDFKMIL